MEDILPRMVSGEMRGSVSFVYFLYCLNNLTILCVLHPAFCLVSGFQVLQAFPVTCLSLCTLGWEVTCWIEKLFLIFPLYFPPRNNICSTARDARFMHSFLYLGRKTESLTLHRYGQTAYSACSTIQQPVSRPQLLS